MSQKDRSKAQDSEALHLLAYLLELESDRLVETKKDTWITDMAQLSLGDARVPLSQFLRAVAQAIRAFADTHLS